MSSEKQAVANRRNAKLSTGPSTEAGKVVSAKNALKHGLSSTSPLLDWEAEPEYRQFVDDVAKDLKPVGVVEAELANRVAILFWRLRRFSTVEAGILLREHSNVLASYADKQVNKYCQTETRSTFPELDFTETIVTMIDEDAHNEAQKWVEEEVSRMHSPLPVFSNAFMQAEESDSFAKLARYETALERQLSRTLSLLRSLQAARMGSGA